MTAVGIRDGERKSHARECSPNFGEHNEVPLLQALLLYRGHSDRSQHAAHHGITLFDARGWQTSTRVLGHGCL